jgi:uncharacterized membrane protein YkvA (DUF1232 family)
VGAGVKALIRAVPRLVRMVGSLLIDSAVPRTAKVFLAAVALYLASPLDLVPDFVPVVGYVDDLLLVALAVDGLLNVLDRGVVLRYWPGSPESLETTAAVARRLARWVPRRVKARIFTRRGR